MSAYEQWIAFLTIMRKEVRRYLRMDSDTPAIGHHDVAVLTFGTLIGKRIAPWVVLYGVRRTWPHHDGHHYEHPPPTLARFWREV